jgi:predicted HAD superfamily phosphohydrolase
LEGRWKEMDIMRGEVERDGYNEGRTCKKVLRIPRFATNWVDQREVERDSKVVKVLCLAAE